jgi:hypothetical protein
MPQWWYGLCCDAHILHEGGLLADHASALSRDELVERVSSHRPDLSLVIECYSSYLWNILFVETPSDDVIRDLSMGRWIKRGRVDHKVPNFDLFKELVKKGYIRSEEVLQRTPLTSWQEFDQAKSYKSCPELYDWCKPCLLRLFQKWLAESSSRTYQSFHVMASKELTAADPPDPDELFPLLHLSSFVSLDGALTRAGKQLAVSSEFTSFHSKLTSASKSTPEAIKAVLPLVSLHIHRRLIGCHESGSNISYPTLRLGQIG